MFCKLYAVPKVIFKRIVFCFCVNRLGQVVKTEKLKGEGFAKYFTRDSSNKVQDEGQEKADVNQEEQPMEMDSNKHQEEVS